MPWLAESRGSLPRPAVSAISTVAAVAILWHRRGTSRVELRLWGVIERAVVCPRLRHGFRFNPGARLRFVVSSISLVFHPHIVNGREAGVERIRKNRRRCHAAAESIWLPTPDASRFGIGFREKPVSVHKRRKCRLSGCGRSTGRGQFL